MIKGNVNLLGVFKSGPVDYQEELYSEGYKIYKLRVIFQVGSLYYELFFHSHPIRKYIHKLTLYNLRGIHHVNKYVNFPKIDEKLKPKLNESTVDYLDFSENPVCWYIEKGLRGVKTHQLFTEFGKLIR